MIFQIKPNDKQFYWVLNARNGEPIAVSGESYWNKSDCLNGTNLVKRTTSASQYEVYQDVKREWRWRLQANNNRIVAASSEGYVSRQGADNGVALAVSTDGATPVEDLT